MGEALATMDTDQPGYSSIIRNKQSRQVMQGSGWKSIPPQCWEREQGEEVDMCACVRVTEAFLFVGWLVQGIEPRGA